MKKTILLVNAFVFTLILNAQTPNFKWAVSAETGGFVAGHSIVTDASGNVYTTGSFSGTCDFDPGPGNAILYSLSEEADIFISKFDANGKFLWVKKMGSYYKDDLSFGIALDAKNNVYVTGIFYGTVDFDPGPGVYNLKIEDLQYSDIFILKLTSDGNFVWARQLQGKSEEMVFSIAVDDLGNVYTAGRFLDTVDFNPGAGVYKIGHSKAKNGSDYFDGFVLKLNASGNFVWAQRVGGDHQDKCNSIAADKFGYIYMTGEFTNKVDFDPGSGIFELQTSQGGTQDIFILKLDTSGAFVWAKSMMGVNEQIGFDIKLDNWGNIYTTGSFQSTTDFDPGAGVYELTPSNSGYSHVFMTKLNANGSFVWAKDLGEMDFSLLGDNFSPRLHLWEFAIDKFGNIYRIGGFNVPTDFDPGPGTFNLTSSGGYDIFISKLDSAGKFIWAQKMGSKSDDVGNGIALDASGNILITGWFKDSVDFDLGTGKYNLKSLGDHALFINKMGQGTGDIKGNIVKSNITIYPNPASNILNIDNINNTNSKIQIFNSLGQILLDESLLPNHSSLDLQKLPSGLLIVKVIERGNVLSVQRILKQ